MRILVTGGTGSFGHAFLESCIVRPEVESVVIFSRDEMKQWEMAQRFEFYDKVSFELGDIRDVTALKRSALGADLIVHAAATKIVPSAEYNPTECLKTNVIGAMNVVEVATDLSIPKVVALSTDKACNPINLYGASKLASDKLFIAATLKTSQSSFAVVRYGNVMGSRGSVIPFFYSRKVSGVLPITDPRMTRFMITLEQGVDLVWHAVADMIGGEIYVKKIPSMKVVDIAATIASECKLEIVGIRPGEKIHEQMVVREDAFGTFEYPKYYKILPRLNEIHTDAARIKDGISVDKEFVYDSGSNPDFMCKTELEGWLIKNGYA